jgi:hypothetical protein
MNLDRQIKSTVLMTLAFLICCATPSKQRPATKTVPLPTFAKLDLDIDKEFPRQARQKLAGNVYESPDSPAWSVAEGYQIWLTTTVIDPDTNGNPRKPRLLCIQDDYRIAAYVDVSSLATVSSSLAVIAPTAESVKSIDKYPAHAPGIRLAPGTDLTMLGTTQGTKVKVQHDGLFLTAEGWLDQKLIDAVYLPDTLPLGGQIDGEIIEAVDLLDAPNGKAFGRIEKKPKVANELLVSCLKRSDGYVLIRYLEVDNQAVGWVKESSIQLIKPIQLDCDRGVLGLKGRGSGTGQPSDIVALTKGTLLYGPKTNQVVGVITTTADFVCLADCQTDQPLVKCTACSADISVRAKKKQ